MSHNNYKPSVLRQDSDRYGEESPVTNKTEDSPKKMKSIEFSRTESKRNTNKKIYHSRRSKTFDQSFDTQEDVGPVSILDTAAIITKDTQGNVTMN